MICTAIIRKRKIDNKGPATKLPLGMLLTSIMIAKDTIKAIAEIIRRSFLLPILNTLTETFSNGRIRCIPQSPI